MPAYRSAAEAEIRDAVVARLREARPGSRIIHEINVSTYGPNRIDLIAVGEAEIIAVEIKSAKDKLDRLEAQVASMKGVAHTVVAAIHEKFLTEHPTNRSAMHYERDGVAYRRNVPGGFPSAHETWVFPCVRRCATPTFRDDMETWRLKDSAPDRPLPAKALDMLWRDELFALCSRLSIPVHRQANMGELSRALRWNCTGRDLTHGVCSMLRERVCVEADQEIAA